MARCAGMTSRADAARPVGGPHERRPTPIGGPHVDVGAAVQEQDGREPLPRPDGRVQQSHILVVDVEPAREEELDDVAPIRLDGPSEEGPTRRVRDDVARLVDAQRHVGAVLTQRRVLGLALLQEDPEARPLGVWVGGLERRASESLEVEIGGRGQQRAWLKHLARGGLVGTACIPLPKPRRPCSGWREGACAAIRQAFRRNSALCSGTSSKSERSQPAG